MAKKISQKELSLLRADYLLKKEALMVDNVNTMASTLFEKVFDKYLVSLEQEGGKLIYNSKNISMVKGLDKIYAEFNKSTNVPNIKLFNSDVQGIIPLNETYFLNMQQEGVRAVTPSVSAAVNKSLGLTPQGKVIKNGFADKFITDKAVVTKIKKETMSAISSGKDFTTFRHQLKTTIEGVPKEKLSGAVQQYYRNYAYDTYQKTDRLSQDKFASELGMRYFFWQGGLIATSRNICEHCNSKLIDSYEYKKLKFSDLKKQYQEGLSPDWSPMVDMGYHGCRHSKDFVSNALAEVLKDKKLNIASLKK